MQEIAITATIASASGAPCASRTSASHAIGAPRISRNAVGDPNSQYAYGRRDAIPTS